MGSIARTRLGIQAGLLGGAVVAALFFVLDLARLEPLRTATALSARFLGPTSPMLDLPVFSQLLSVAVFAGNLVALTLLHFLAFSLLGVGAVWGSEKLRVPLNAATGALYGVTLGTTAFFGCVALCGTQVLAGSPGLTGVVLANVASGAVMGGFVQMVKAAPLQAPPDTAPSPGLPSPRLAPEP